MRQTVRPVTVLDYLYRLRIKANYEDASMYTEGPLHDGDAQQAGRHLLRLVAAGLLVHEIRIARTIGKQALIEMVDSWLTSNKADRASTLALRRELLTELA